MRKYLLRKMLIIGIVVLFFGISFTNASFSSSVYESKISTNDGNILKFITARILIYWYDGVEYEGSGGDIFWGNEVEGPFGFFSYGFGWVLNISIFIINGRIDVKPLNSPRLTLSAGDKLSIMADFGFGIYDCDGNGIDVSRAFGVTIEKA